MAGLTDMEELIATVPEKDIANYLREAFVCYGAGAYRGCIVLTHTALFEGLRTKLHAVAAVNSKAREVLAMIEPLASKQKVFESKLIDQMKAGTIITQLEADILEQLNKQRNKAAHPSGHLVTAEEARFVFSEAIQKFLSQPIRQTSVLVDAIITRLPEPNFFPSTIFSDITLVVDEETESLDILGLPQLVVKIAGMLDSDDPIAVQNAERFLLVLTSRKDTNLRESIIKAVITPKATTGTHATLIAQLAAVDPAILKSAPPVTKARVATLLLSNGKTVGVSVPYAELRNPAHVLASAVKELGETFMLANYKDFTDWVIDEAPTAPEFIDGIAGTPTLFSQLQLRYRAKAAHSQFAESNAFASVLPGIDAALGKAASDEQAFWLLAAVVKGAYWGAYTSIALRDAHFQALPTLRAKALAFVPADTPKAQEILDSSYFTGSPTEFSAQYLEDALPP
ncbi:hypothetical protein K6W36_15530 [Acetobacter senegalensis]|uniref:hypothetical protein n=1 Tax=Acetobacter senegalensis TaxID=446692 RepID=UPI001ED9DA35|nr:hypothetical protein [Acetobacter senegalensis]MCG4261968.1 hypothetical protein [Acetobacter senegalensis]